VTAKKTRKSKESCKKEDYLKLCEEEVFNLQSGITEIESLFEIKKDSIVAKEVSFESLEELAMKESRDLFEKKRKLFVWREEKDAIPEKFAMFFPNFNSNEQIKEEINPLERCNSCIHLNGTKNCPYITIFQKFLKKTKRDTDDCPSGCNPYCYYSKDMLIEVICLQSASAEQIEKIEQVIRIHDECVKNNNWGIGKNTCNIHEFIPLVRNGIEIRNLKIDFQKSIERWENMYNTAEACIAINPKNAEIILLEILTDLWSLRIELKMHGFSPEGQFISALDGLRNKITNCISYLKSGSNKKLIERLNFAI